MTSKQNAQVESFDLLIDELNNVAIFEPLFVIVYQAIDHELHIKELSFI